MALYTVKNQWGGSKAPWNDAGTWVLGCRNNQTVTSIRISSTDGGKTLTGTMIYEGEGEIGVRATQIGGNNYKVENQWGGEGAEWHPGGNWIIGSRDAQRVVSLEVAASQGNNLSGNMVYEGEGPIGFEGSLVPGSSYTVENQWGGSSAAWNLAGTFVLGTRANQNPVAFNINSTDGGKTLNGTMTYSGEGPIGFKAMLTNGNNYSVENQWGGNDAPWHEAGNFVIGARDGQGVVNLTITSNDNGATFTGEMTYSGEGPIGFKAALSSCANSL